MRILHVINELDPKRGGPPIVAASLAAAQAAAGHDVGLMYWGFDPQHQSPADEPLREVTPHWDKLEHLRLAPASPVEKLFGRNAAKAAEKHFAKPVDVVHLHRVWESILPAVAKVAKRHATPYIITPHGMLDRWSMEQKSLKKKIALRLGYRAMLDHAAALHTLNADEETGIEPLGLKAQLMRLPNGVWPELFEPPVDAPSFRSAHPALGNAPFVLFLSRLHHKKGLDYLVPAFDAAAADRPGVHLVVAGPDRGGADELNALVQRSPHRERIHVVGPLYGDAKFAALREAAVYCLPSRQEGFPIAVLEALASGVAVVISRSCNVPEVAEAEAGRVVELEVDAVAEAMGELLDDAALRARMGAAGKQLVADRFSWAKVADQSIEAYERLLSR